MLLLTFGNRHTVVVVLLSDAVPISGQPSLLRKPYFFFFLLLSADRSALLGRGRGGEADRREKTEAQLSFSVELEYQSIFRSLVETPLLDLITQAVFFASNKKPPPAFPLSCDLLLGLLPRLLRSQPIKSESLGARTKSVTSKLVSPEVPPFGFECPAS